MDTTMPLPQEAPTGAAQRLVLSEAGSPDRPELEAFVQDAFRHRHGAQISSFMPMLLGLRGRGGRLACVTGYRSAASERLYLEHYLDRPVEEELGTQVGRRIARAEVVEVGNLAGGSCRAAVRMVTMLPAHLLSLGHEWIVFTATSTVYGILQAVGAPLLELAPASESRVASTGHHWGGYYEHDPRVFAGHLPDGLRLGTFRRAGRRSAAHA